MVVIFVVVVTVVMLALAWRILDWVWLRPKSLERCLREQGLAGNSYRLFSGDLKGISMMTKQARSKPISLDDDALPRVIPFVHHTLENYGKNSFIWFGLTPRVFITEPEQIKDVFNKIGEFRKSRVTPLTNLLSTGLVSYEDEKWAKHRKIINPAFRVEKLKDMLHAFYESCSDILRQWERLIGEEGSCEVDVWPYLENLSSDVISRAAFGSSYMEGRSIFQLQKEQKKLLLKAVQSVYVPGWRFVPTKLNNRMKEINREVQTLLKGIINKRERERKAGNFTNNDLLGILLESNSRELKEKNAAMNKTDVIEECKLFYIAGQEGASVLLLWTMVLLSKYPNWQARAREEVLEIFGKNKPDFDGLNHLKVVTMILHEVLRLYPPVPIVNRVIQKDIKLKNLIIPAGVEVSLPIMFVHHDCELWGDDAKQFNPERFLEGVSKATKGQLSFFPFAAGPRICIGQNFAMMEAKMALSLMLQHFSFEISPSYAHAPFSVTTVQPQFGAHIILHKL